jgi:coenzyme F420-reducing hydrogenase delta subunit
MTKKNWNPKIVAFVCNWCTYAGADLAGTSRLKYDASIRVLRVPCTGRIDTLFIVKAYEQGADCVLVSGCHPGDCHYDAGNYHARRRCFLGIDDRRLQFSSVSAAEGVKWAKLINGLVEEIKSKGPFKAYQMLTR